MMKLNIVIINQKKNASGGSFRNEPMTFHGIEGVIMLKYLDL